MKKENMLAAMMFGGQAGGGGGGSSEVLDVVCTATYNVDHYSYSYSHTGQEAFAAMNSGKVVRLWIKYGVKTYATFQMRSTELYLYFILANQELLAASDSLARMYYCSEEGGWTVVGDEKSQILLPIMSMNSFVRVKPFSVAMYADTDSDAYYAPIMQHIDFGSSIQTLIMGAYSYAGTAIGTTITDPDSLPLLADVVSSIEKNLSSQRPIVITLETGSGIVAKAMLNDARYDNGVLQAFSLSFSDFVFSSGIPTDLLRVNLSVSLAYDNSEDLSSVTLVALCDSKNITFM